MDISEIEELKARIIAEAKARLAKAEHVPAAVYFIVKYDEGIYGAILVPGVNQFFESREHQQLLWTQLNHVWKTIKSKRQSADNLSYKTVELHEAWLMLDQWMTKKTERPADPNWQVRHDPDRFECIGLYCASKDRMTSTLHVYERQKGKGIAFLREEGPAEIHKSTYDKLYPDSAR